MLKKLLQSAAYTAYIVVIGFAAAGSFIASANDYRFPTRSAALGRVEEVASPSVGEIIRGQEPRPLSFTSSPLSSPPSSAAPPAVQPASSNSRGNTLADAEMAIRPPDPVGTMDTTTIPEAIKPKPYSSGGHATDEEPVVGALDPPGAVAGHGGWNTLLLVFALAAGGMAAYATFAALDYRQRWEQALLDQNDRLLGGFSGLSGFSFDAESVAMPPW